jgi:hypothetical protein
VAQSAGVHDPAHAHMLAEWGSLGGQAAVEAGAGIFNPAHAGAVAEGRPLGGQAAGAAKRTDMADVRFLQAEQEARGGPVVGSRKRTAVQRMNL